MRTLSHGFVRFVRGAGRSTSLAIGAVLLAVVLEPQGREPQGEVCVRVAGRV